MLTKDRQPAKKSLSGEVLEKIQQEKIKPKPKWEFTLKNIILGAVFSLSVIIGSLISSVLIYMLVNSDWDLHHYIGHSLLKLFFITFPYLWLIFFVVFLLLASYNFQSIKGGYRYRLPIIIGSSIFVCIVFGTLFYYFGLGRMIENNLRARWPVYYDLRQQQEEVWMRPEDGSLVGRVIVIEDDQLRLIDIRDKTWQVTDLDQAKKGRIELTEGLLLKIIGEQVDASVFRAEIIRLMMGPPPGPGMPGGQPWFDKNNPHFQEYRPLKEKLLKCASTDVKCGNNVREFDN